MPRTDSIDRTAVQGTGAETNPTVEPPSRDRIRGAAELLKALSHESRLAILVLLATREHSVRELEIALDLRQPAVSQQLARLRADGLVGTRRDGKSVFYSLASTDVRHFVETLYRMLGAPTPAEGLDVG